MAKQNSYLMSDQHTATLSGAPAVIATQTTRVKLPLSGYITHIDCKLNVQFAVGAAVGQLNQDSMGRAISAMRIKASGARNFVDFSDGRQWYYFDRLQYKGQLIDDAGTAANAALGIASYSYDCMFPIHLGLQPYDHYDTSVVIPAVECTDLTMEVVWAPSTAWIASAGGTITFTSATMQLTVYEIALAPGEKRSLIWPNGLLIPRFEPQIITTASSHSNYGLVSDLPVGDTLNRTVMMVLDTSGGAGADVRANNNVTQYAVKFPKLRETPFEREMVQAVGETQTRQGLAAAVVGVTQIDGSQLSGRAVGLDLTRAVTGDAQLGFTNTIAGPITGTDIHLLHYMIG